jgi:ribose transport system permease protein
MSTVLPPADPTGAPPAMRGETARRFYRTSEFSLAVISVVGFCVLAVATDFNLLTGGTLGAFFRFLAVPIVIGLAQMVVLGVGQMNLSVGALTGYCAMTAASLMVEHQVPAVLAVAVAVGLGTFVGAVNGVLVVVTRINGFIVTLATMTVLEGLRYGVAGSGTLQGYSPGLQRLGGASLLGIPLIFLAALGVAGLVAFYFRRTVSGRSLLASGGNPFAARLSGISNDRSLVVAHTLSGLLVGVASVLVVAGSGSVNTSIGDDLLLPSFAAPIIGGVALTGGAVSVVGTVLAAFIIRMVDVTQAQFDIDRRWVDLVVGVVVLGAVLIGRVREAVATRMRGGAS